MQRALVALTGPSRMSLRKQLGLGLVAYLGILVTLVALRISGSSMGSLYGLFFSGADPRLLAGAPRSIRSDEWLVVAPLTVAQVEQGLPSVSGVFPGGFNTTIVWDLPYREWSVLLRPHMWGFFFLPLDNAFALKWWLPFMAMAAVVFVFLCVLWQRPLASFAAAGAFAVSPFFMWWFGSGSFWPPAAAVAACAATMIMLRTSQVWIRWAVGGAVAYLVAVAAVALYPPYLIPSLYPALGFCLGWFFTSSAAAVPWRERLRRIAPLGVGAVAVVAVLAAYLLTRLDTVNAVMSTVYPGQRLESTGDAASFPWRAMYAGIFGMGLRAGDLAGFAPNASEGSSFILLGLFLLPSVAWLVWSRWRRGEGVDWALVGSAAAIALLLGFVYVPGWDAVAHLLFLDRTTLPRVVIGIGLGSVLLLGLVVARLRDDEVRIPLWTTAAVVASVLAVHAAVYASVARTTPDVIATTNGWPVLLLVMAVAMGLFSRGWTTAPAVAVAAVGLVVAGWVNPLYQGVLDLRATDIGERIQSIDESSPGAWVAVGGLGATAVLRETGVEAYSGVQAWPPDEMWEDIDPDESGEEMWNRYAHVNWTPDLAAPEMTLVQADVVQLRFDSCSRFAQDDVDYVLSDAPVEQACLEPLVVVPEDVATYYVYDVVSPR